MNLNWMLVGLVAFGLNANAKTMGEARMASYIKYNDNSIPAPVSMMTTKLKLLVNDAIDPLAPDFDSEIPGHGHYNYTLSGTIEDSAGQCKFSVLWFQENAPLKNTKQLLEMGVDSNPKWNSIRLCTGLILKFESVRKLLISGSSQNIAVYAPGVSTPIFKGEMEMKEAPAPVPVKEDPLKDPCQH